jgi:hypothetical protein
MKILRFPNECNEKKFFTGHIRKSLSGKAIYEGKISLKELAG